MMVVGIVQLLTTLLLFGAIWSLIHGIVMLVVAVGPTDPQRQLQNDQDAHQTGVV